MVTSPTSFRLSDWIHFVTKVPALRVVATRRFDLSTPQGIPLAQFTRWVCNEYHRLVRPPTEWDATGRYGIFSDLLEKMTTSVERDFVVHLQDDIGSHQGLLVGLLIASWTPPSFGEEALRAWVPALFPSLQGGWREELGQFYGDVQDLIGDIPPSFARGDPSEQEKRAGRHVLSEIEARMIDQYGTMTTLLTETYHHLKNGDNREQALAQLFWHFAILEATNEIIKKAVVSLSQHLPEGFERVAAERHNLQTLFAMAQAFLVLDLSRMRQHVTLEKDTFGGCWTTAVQMVAYLNPIYQSGPDGLLHFTGHIPLATVTRFKKHPILTDTEVRLSVTVDPKIHGLKITPEAMTNRFPTIFHQLCLALLSNAIKYCNLREKHPAIEIVLHENTQGNVEFQVGDNGLGIRDIDGALRGKRLLRGEAVTLGGGQGLPWAQRIVQQWGGELTIESRVGRPLGFLPTWAWVRRLIPAGGGSTKITVMIPAHFFARG